MCKTPGCSTSSFVRFPLFWVTKRKAWRRDEPFLFMIQCSQHTEKARRITLLWRHRLLAIRRFHWLWGSSVAYYQAFQVPFTSPWRWKQHGPPKLWYPTTSLHDVISQKITTWITIQAPLTSPWRWMQQGPPKRWYPTTSLHGVDPEDHDLNLYPNPTHFTLKMEAVRCSETLVSYITIWCQTQTATWWYRRTDQRETLGALNILFVFQFDTICVPRNLSLLFISCPTFDCLQYNATIIRSSSQLPC